MGEVRGLNVGTVTVIDTGDVAPDVWAELIDAVGAVAVSVGPSHVELPVAAHRSWSWWFATPHAGLWIWDSLAARRVVSHSSAAVEVDAVLALDLTSQAMWPEQVASLDALGLARSLTGPQVRDVARMLRLGGGANFSVPGAGKTTMAYAVWAAMRAAGSVTRCLVVAPLSAHESWQNELAEVFTPSARPIIRVRPDSLGGDIVVVNYERLESLAHLEQLLQWCRAAPTLVIFDEAHRAKAGRDGVRGAAARRLAEVAERRIVLTGTPRPNADTDLVNILDLAYPGMGASLATAGPTRLARAYTRVTKAELNLPPLVARIERVPLSGAHDRVYDAFVDSAVRASISDPSLAADIARAGRIAMMLLQAATDPTAVVDSSGDLSVVRDRDDETLDQLLSDLPGSFTPTKFVRIVQLVDEHRAAGTKVLVWACFRHHAERLRTLLAPYAPAVVHGGVCAADRASNIERFRLDPSSVVLVATPHTLAEGISLHRTTTHQIHLDRPFNAGMFLQSLDRTHRLGLPADTLCTATFLHAVRSDGSDTVDEVVGRCLDRKVKAMARILNDPSLANLALPSIDDILGTDDILLGTDRADDLRALFAHLVRARA